MLASALLRRSRLADPQHGIWDAADVQWWSRRPRRSDRVEKLFWVDSEGPVAGVLLTSWTDESWQCDPIVVSRAPDLEPEAVWARALGEIRAHAEGRVAVPVQGGDATFRALAERSGLVPGDRSSTAWMNALDRPRVQPLPEGFTLVDRTQRRDRPHPMRGRNGEEVEERLRECPLYAADLDLAVEANDGSIAGYSLYWYDAATNVGMVEPVRVEDAYQRRGLARAMLTAGLSRLASRGAKRVKIGYEAEGAAALYGSIGFRTTSADTWYEARVEHLIGAAGA